MKTRRLTIVFVGLMIALAPEMVAAPAPAHLAQLAPLKAERPRGLIRNLIFSSDSKTLFSLDDVGIVRFWDVASRENTATLETVPPGGRFFTWPHHRQMILSPDGSTLFTKDNDDRIWLWDVASRKHVATLEHKSENDDRLIHMVLSADGKTAAGLWGQLRSDKTIVLWDVAKRKLIGTIKEDEEVEVSTILLSPDGKTLSTLVKPRIKPGVRLAQRTRDTLRIWDVAKRERRRSCQTGTLVPISADWPLKKPVLAEISPRTIPVRPVVPVKTLSFRLIDPFTGDTVLTCEWDKKEDEQMPQIFVPNRAETILASYALFGRNPPLRLWDMASGKCIAVFKPPRADISVGLDFSPDGKNLVFVYDGRQASGHFLCGLLLYAVPSGKILAELKFKVDHPVVFSPDGRLMATRGGWDIRLWSIPDEWRKKDK